MWQSWCVPTDNWILPPCCQWYAKQQFIPNKNKDYLNGAAADHLQPLQAINYRVAKRNRERKMTSTGAGVGAGVPLGEDLKTQLVSTFGEDFSLDNDSDKT
jgi:hypothetical protein